MKSNILITSSNESIVDFHSQLDSSIDFVSNENEIYEDIVFYKIRYDNRYSISIDDCQYVYIENRDISVHVRVDNIMFWAILDLNE